MLTDGAVRQFRGREFQSLGTISIQRIIMYAMQLHRARERHQHHSMKAAVRWSFWWYIYTNEKQEPEVSANKCKLSITPIAYYSGDQGVPEQPRRTTTERTRGFFWRGEFSINARLKVCAKFIFSVLVSSAGAERLTKPTRHHQFELSKSKVKMSPKFISISIDQMTSIWSVFFQFVRRQTDRRIQTPL